MTADKQSSLPSTTQRCDFVQRFPPELSNVLLNYVSDRDLFSCCQCSISWRNVLNNDQQWSRRCLRRGWTTNHCMNEAYAWKDLSHVKKCNSISFRPTPEYVYPLAFGEVKPLNSLCEWAVYYRPRLHVHINWTRGTYIVHKLIAPESETDSLVINSSTFNGKYIALGTTLGYVFIWDVSGVPELRMTFEPIRRNIEVEKVLLTSIHLVVLYEDGVIRVYEEKEKQFTKQPPFQIIYQTKVYYNFFRENCDIPVFQIETFSRRDMNLLLNSNKEMEIWDSIFLSQYDKTEEIAQADILISATEEHVFLTTQDAGCYIVWDLHTGKSEMLHLLPVNCQVLLMTLGYNLCIFSTQLCNTEKHSLKFGIVVYNIGDSKFKTTKPILETIEPKIIDEIGVADGGEKIACCSQEGLISAYQIVTNPAQRLFLNDTASCIDNLTVSDEIIFYHDCGDRVIVALRWTGDILYKIKERLIGPVKGMSCFGPYLISGGAVRQLIVWDKLSGRKLHTVYHQPSYILQLYVTSTSILTVGKDDPPAMIGYL